MIAETSSSAALSGNSRDTATLGRAATLALLALAVVISAGPLFLWPDATWLTWWANACWLIVVPVTTWKCLDVARALHGHERRGWLCIGLAFVAYTIGGLIWAVYELILKAPVPFPSPADIGYFACPLFLMVGIWLYRTPGPTLGATLIQLGNFGIIASAIFVANLILFHDAFAASDGFAESAILFAYVVIWSSVFVFVVFNIGFCMQGRRRLVMLPLLASTGVLALVDFWATFEILLGVYSSTCACNAPYLLAFALAYWAAFEQEQLPDTSAQDVRPQAPEARATQWETLLPPLATAGVLVVALTERDKLIPDIVPYAAAGVLLFVVSLALRDWWVHRVELELREHAEESQAQLQESQARLLEKNQELAEANRELLEEMQARVRVQEELRHAQKMEALGHLTGGVAHDFNNLLAVVLGNLELLQQQLGTDSERSALASEAAGAAERGAALTQRLLAFSRKQQLTPRLLDVRTHLEEMRSMLQSILSETIRLEIRAPEDLWLCMADSAQLENAILNLVINARDAMSNGGRIAIEASNLSLDEAGAAALSETRPGSYVAISVRDSGVGIPDEIQSKIFDPFFTTKEVGAGSGLGLSMVYGFAKQSGGFVSLESEVAVGTEVRLCLPRVEVEEGSQGIGDSGVMPRGNGESVLLVEDEPAVRRLLATTLEDLSYAVRQARNGAEALTILDADASVDAILSDVVLPGALSGADLIREAARRRPGVKSLLMSGYASEMPERSEAPPEGVRLLQKPFKRGQLARVLRAVLDGR